MLMCLYDNRCTHTRLLKANKANNFESLEAFVCRHVWQDAGETEQQQQQ